MKTNNPLLPLGYSPLASGQIATVVTCLEMMAKPRVRPVPSPPYDVTLSRARPPDLDAYRQLFRRIGQDWLWSSRLEMSDEQLRAAIEPADVEVHVLSRSSEPIGLLELDFSQPDECELVFFGLVPSAVGHGIGRHLMDRAIGMAWAHPIRRFWVHTCTFDHPGAVDFYRRSGFTPYMFAVEVITDPRLTGDLPPEAAPHIPSLPTSG